MTRTPTAKPYPRPGRSIKSLIIPVIVAVTTIGTLLLFRSRSGVLSPLIACTTNISATLDSKMPKSPPFSLLVTLQFSEVQYKEQFLRDIQPLAEYVRTQEPMTLAYEVLLSDKDDRQVLILERYKDKEVAFVQVHRTSEPFLEFRPKLKAMQDAGHVTVSGHSYLDSMVGFGDRA